MRTSAALPFFVLTLLLGPHVVTAGAQEATTTDTPIQDPKRVTFEHDGRDVSGFVAYVTPEGGSALRLDLGALKPNGSGQVIADLPPLPAGKYQVEIAAYNDAGESPRIVAAPGTFLVTAGTASASHSHSGHEAPQQPAARPQEDSSPKALESKGGGLFNRLWKVVVGDDSKE